MTTQLQNGTAHESAASCGANCEGARYTPRFDVVETADEVTLYGDLPGVQPGDLEITFENQELVIHGKVSPRWGAGNRYWAREYGVGDFHRTFAVSAGIDAQKIQAELTNGVLALHLPKAEAIKPRRIQVNAN